jgi:hypothetical protein
MTIECKLISGDGRTANKDTLLNRLKKKMGYSKPEKDNAGNELEKQKKFDKILNSYGQQYNLNNILEDIKQQILVNNISQNDLYKCNMSFEDVSWPNGSKCINYIYSECGQILLQPIPVNCSTADQINFVKQWCDAARFMCMKNRLSEYGNIDLIRAVQNADITPLIGLICQNNITPALYLGAQILLLKLDWFIKDRGITIMNLPEIMMDQSQLTLTGLVKKIALDYNTQDAIHLWINPNYFNELIKFGVSGMYSSNPMSFDVTNNGLISGLSGSETVIDLALILRALVDHPDLKVKFRQYLLPGITSSADLIQVGLFVKTGEALGDIVLKHPYIDMINNHNFPVFWTPNTVESSECYLPTCLEFIKEINSRYERNKIALDVAQNYIYECKTMYSKHNDEELDKYLVN